MDPNEALRQMREAIVRLRAAQDELDRVADGPSADAEHEATVLVLQEAQTVAEFAEALDEWLSRGGFLPTAWAAAIPTDHDAIVVTGGED